MCSDYFGRVSWLESVSRFPRLFAELVRRGFCERDIVKITSETMPRVLRRMVAALQRADSTRRRES
jgi:microsomal dipeptidase-like Zn-dependent dipeptidase